MTLDPRIASAVEVDLLRLQAHADLLVLQHRAAIERLARALAEKRHLDGPEIEALIGLEIIPGRSSP